MAQDVFKSEKDSIILGGISCPDVKKYNFKESVESFYLYPIVSLADT